jgi:hypothetical protein
MIGFLQVYNLYNNVKSRVKVEQMGFESIYTEKITQTSCLLSELLK